MSDLPDRALTIAVPHAVYAALAAQAEDNGQSVEEHAAALLASAARVGAPGDLHAAALLAAQAADDLADRWERRRGELARLHDELLRVAAALGDVAAGA